MKNILYTLLLFSSLAFAQSHHSYDINEDGSVVCYSNYDPFSGNSSIITYKKENNIWVQMGDDITFSDYENSFFGYNGLSLSNNGQIILVNSLFEGVSINPTVINTHYSKINTYRFDSSNWIEDDDYISLQRHLSALEMDDNYFIAMTYLNSSLDQQLNKMEVFKLNGNDWANHFSSIALGDLGNTQHQNLHPMSFKNGVLIFFTTEIVESPDLGVYFNPSQLHIKRIY